MFAEIPADVETTERPDRDEGENGADLVEEEEERRSMTSSRRGDDMHAQEELELELEEVKRGSWRQRIFESRSLSEELERSHESHEQAQQGKDQEVSNLTDKVRHENERYSTLWRIDCQQLADYNDSIAS